MPKRASEKRTRGYTTWVSEGVSSRLEDTARSLGWTPCQLIRQAVESKLPDLERAAALLESRAPEKRR